MGGCQQFIKGVMMLFIKDGSTPAPAVLLLVPPDEDDVDGGSGEIDTSWGIGPMQNECGCLPATMLLSVLCLFVSLCVFTPV